MNGVIGLVQFIFVDRFFIPLTVEELFLLNQENPYVKQMLVEAF